LLSSSSSVEVSSSSSGEVEVSSSSVGLSSSSSEEVSSSSVSVSSSSSEEVFSSSSEILSSSSVEPSSSSEEAPSSSIEASSSSTVLNSSSSSVSIIKCGTQNINTGTYFCDIRDSKIYKWVRIGDQIWMAQNLNFDIKDSKCYNGLESNCDIYGRLYDWATAMTLPENCNVNTCVSEVNNKHQGICPDGWHVPSYEEWDELLTAVGGWETAGTKLKVKIGWNNCGTSGSGSSYSCEDTYGFSALPAGLGFSNGSFDNIGNGSDWWSYSEIGNYNAYSWYMSHYLEYASWYNNPKTRLFSLRCLQNQ